MPRRGRPGTLASEENVARRVAYEREQRGWSTGELARRVTEAGCPMNQSAVWRLESGEPRRRITVDELVALAGVFGIPAAELMVPPEQAQDLVAHELALKANRLHEQRQYIAAQREKVVEEIRAHLARFPSSVRVVREAVSALDPEAACTLFQELADCRPG